MCSKDSSSLPIRLGISRCLLGDAVRYDGGHKYDRVLVKMLEPHVEWIPVCPEVEAGFGTPRESMHLVDDLEQPRFITISSNKDQTDHMSQYAKKRVRDLQALNLSGYVFKKDSPSCGIRHVHILNRNGKRLGTGKGLFANAFQQRFPLTPIEEEAHLHDPGRREHFLERVLAYHRWQCFTANRRLTQKALLAFHTTHHSLVLAHSPRHSQQLDQLVANAKQVVPRHLSHVYVRLLMEAFSVATTVQKQTTVLRQLAGQVIRKLSTIAQRELHERIHDYQKGRVPLDVPITLLAHHARMLEMSSLADQVYLAPRPKGC